MVNSYPGKAIVEQAEALNEKTPFFLYDSGHISKQIENIRSAFRPYLNFELLYAVKANNNPELLAQLGKTGVGFHVSTIEEINAVRSLSRDISFTGPLLTSEILESSKKYGVKINANNIVDLRRAAELNTIGLRVNPGIGWSYASGIASAHSQSHFGVLKAEFDRTPSWLKKRVVRLHMHTNSDSYRIDIFAKGLRRLLKIAERCPSITTINVGGGIAVPIGKGEVDFDIKGYAKTMIAEVVRFNKKHGRNLTLQIEPGNYIVRGAGYYVTRVHSVLQRRRKHYFFSDGTNHHIRGLMGKKEVYSIRNPGMVTGAIVGASCQVGDILVPFQKMPLLREDDLVAIPKVGAYCAVQAARFHMIGFRERLCFIK